MSSIEFGNRTKSNSQRNNRTIELNRTFWFLNSWIFCKTGVKNQEQVFEGWFTSVYIIFFVFSRKHILAWYVFKRIYLPISWMQSIGLCLIEFSCQIQSNNLMDLVRFCLICLEIKLVQSLVFDLVRLLNSIKLNPWIEFDFRTFDWPCQMSF